jgi:hypothetical protein
MIPLRQFLFEKEEINVNLEKQQQK